MGVWARGGLGDGPGSQTHLCCICAGPPYHSGMERRVPLVAGCVGMLLAWCGPVGAASADPPSAPGAGATEREQSPLRVVVSIAPLRGLVEPLLKEAGIAGSVEVLIPPGRSEHGFEYPPSRLARLESADLVVLVGMGLDKPVRKFIDSLPARAQASKKRRVVVFADAVGLDGARGAEGEPGHEGHGEGPHDHGPEHGHGHDHGAACEHDHHGPDPHLWLDPVLVGRLVGVVADELADAVGRGTPGAARVEAAGKDLQARVKAVDEEYARVCAGFASKTIVVGHDAWGRLGARYGLETVPIAGLTATEPTPGALEKAASVVKARGLRVIFVEPQISDRAGRLLAEATGAEVRRLDPLGSGDWFAMMNANLRELERALGPSRPGAGPEKKPDASPGK